jgi:hypothetical protein
MSRNVAHMVAQRSSALHRHESGATLTEFAITLPVFFLLMVGIINVAEVQQGVLVSEQRASANLWKDAVEYQTGGPRAEMVPDVGANTADSYYNKIGQSSSIYSILDTSSLTSGLYSGSYVKAGAANLMPGVTVSPQPRMKLDQIMCSNPSFGFNLMNDEKEADDFNFDNAWGIASLIFNATGTRPGLAAGIRYGTVSGVDESTFGSTDQARVYQADTLTHYVASAPTQPTNRFFAVGLARIEVGTESAYRDTIVFGQNHVGDGVEGIGSCP